MLDITCDRGPLQAALSLLTKICKPQTLHPDFAGIACEAFDDQHLTLRATDGSLHAAITVPATVRAQGAAILPGENLADLVKRAPSPTLTFVQPDAERVRIQYGPRRQSTWKVLSAGPLLTLPAPDAQAPVLRIDPARVLRIPHTHAPVGARADQPRLRTIATYPDADGHCTLLATDGIRISRTVLSHEDSTIATLPIPFWQRLADGLALLATDPDTPQEPLAIQVDDVTCQATLGTLTLTARRTSLEPFPEVSPAFLQTWHTTGTVSRLAWIQAVQRLRVLTSRGAPIIRCLLTPPHLFVCTTNADLDQAAGYEELPNPTLQGPAVTLLVDADLLLQALQMFAGDTLTVAFGTPTQPVHLSDPEDPTTDHLLMPLTPPNPAPSGAA